MYRSILVPLDGSAFSEYALPIAQMIGGKIAAGDPVKLHLVRVHEPVISSYIEGLPVVDQELDLLMREQEAAYLELINTRIAWSTDLQTTRLVLEGPIAPMLNDYIETEQIDLVVMTTHGRGGWERFWLGSIADKLARHSPAPVLLVRPQIDEIQPKAETALQRILIPLDGSETAEDILEYAVDLGWLLDAEYHLLRVVEPVMVTGYSPLIYASDLDTQIMLQQIHDAELYLDTIAERLRDRTRRITTNVVVAAQPAAAILKTAYDYHVDLIAMSTHGRGGISRLLIGSTADKVLRGATVPLLIHHPQTRRIAHKEYAEQEMALAVER